MHAYAAAAAYKKVHVSSSPVRVLEGLYQRLEDDLADARDAMVAGDVKRRCEASNHALRIVSELEAALDHTASAKLCAELVRLYTFIEDMVLRGATQKDAGAYDAARDVVRTLREAFAQASGVT